LLVASNGYKPSCRDSWVETALLAKLMYKTNSKQSKLILRDGWGKVALNTITISLVLLFRKNGEMTLLKQ